MAEGSASLEALSGAEMSVGRVQYTRSVVEGLIDGSLASKASQTADAGESRPSQLTQAENGALSTYFLQKMACANPNCPFLASADCSDGGFCCSKCYWRSVAPKSSKSAKRHNAGCSKTYADTSAVRAPPIPPQEAIAEQADGSQNTLDEAKNEAALQPVSVSPSVPVRAFAVTLDPMQQLLLHIESSQDGS